MSTAMIEMVMDAAVTTGLLDVMGVERIRPYPDFESLRTYVILEAMDDDERFADLERRVTALESDRSRTGVPPERDEGDPLWVLGALAEQLEPPGGVLLAGSVDLPNGQRARWQETRTTDWLLDADLERIAEALAALGNPVRLRLLRQVLAGKTTVQELAATDGIGTTGQVYHHLRQLTATGWLRSTGGGAYQVPVPRLVPLLGTFLTGQP